MSAASSPLLRRLLLAVALLLLHSQLALSITFQLTAQSTGVDYNGKQYTASYNLTLRAFEVGAGSGLYNVTSVSGTRSYNGQTGVAVQQLNEASYGGVPADNQVYFALAEDLLGAQLDGQGIGLPTA